MIKLNKEVIERLREPIRDTWQIIGPDVYDGIETPLTNKGAIEIVIDANYISIHGEDKEAEEIVDKLCLDYSVNKVVNYLSRHINLA